MEPLQTKPVYHHPIPWQVVVALVLNCCNALLLTAQAYLLLNDLEQFPRPTETLVLGILLLAALAAALQVVLAVCIAARQHWARILQITLCVLASCYNLLAVVGLAIIPETFGSGFERDLTLLAYLGLAIGLGLLFMLHNEKAAAYTYRGGGAGYPEE